jgi:hypothetical protein
LGNQIYQVGLLTNSVRVASLKDENHFFHFFGNYFVRNRAARFVFNGGAKVPDL